MLDAPDAIAEPVQPVTIHIGFTGVVFKDMEGKEKREVFAVLMVSKPRSNWRFFFPPHPYPPPPLPSYPEED